MAGRTMISSKTSSMISHFSSLQPSANRWVALGTSESLWPRLLPYMLWRLHCLRGPSSCCPGGWGLFPFLFFLLWQPSSANWVAVDATELLWPVLFPVVLWRLHCPLRPSRCCPSSWGPLLLYFLSVKKEANWKYVGTGKHLKTISMPAA